MLFRRVRDPVLDDDILALDIPVVAQPLPKCFQHPVSSRRVRCWLEEPDPVQSPRWLRPAGKRRGEEAEGDTAD
jgi:hypothetical protein